MDIVVCSLYNDSFPEILFKKTCNILQYIRGVTHFNNDTICFVMCELNVVIMLPYAPPARGAEQGKLHMMHGWWYNKLEYGLI